MEESGILSSNFNMKWMILPSTFTQFSLANHFSHWCLWTYLFPIPLLYEGTSVWLGAMYGSLVLYHVIGILWNIKTFNKPVDSLGYRTPQLWVLVLSFDTQALSDGLYHNIIITSCAFLWSGTRTEKGKIFYQMNKSLLRGTMLVLTMSINWL